MRKWAQNVSDRISDLLHVDQMSISDLNKQKLHSCITSRPDAIEHVVVIKDCVDREELRDNLDGIIELLEYCLDVMRSSSIPDQFSDREYRILHDRIQSLAVRQDQLAREARKTAEAARQASTQVLYEERPRFKSGRRGSKRRGVW